MKYRDPKTGVTCLTIRTAVLQFCGHNSCTDCQLFRFKNHGCWSWAENHPTEAAGLMGYEVIEDSTTEIDDTPTTLDDTPTVSGDRPTEEDDMSKEDKPLSEWTLGQIRKICDAYRCGECPFYSGGEPKCIVNTTPNAWDLKFTPKVPPLTEDEIAIMRAVGARWASREPYDEYVDLWPGRPELVGGRFNGPNGSVNMGRLAAYLFPSVKPGDCVEVPE